MRLGIWTYRDSFSSSRPKHEARPASLISGEKLILWSSAAAGGAGKRDGLIHAFLLAHVGLLSFLECTFLLADGFHAVRLEPGMYAEIRACVRGEGVGELREEGVVEVLHRGRGGAEGEGEGD